MWSSVALGSPAGSAATRARRCEASSNNRFMRSCNSIKSLIGSRLCAMFANLREMSDKLQFVDRRQRIRFKNYLDLVQQILMLGYDKLKFIGLKQLPPMLQY